MKRRERVSSFLIVEAGLILLNILCYGDIRWLLLEQILLFPCFNVLKRKKREKEKHLYEKGFQNLLQSMMTSLQAGYSLNNSCRIALKELGFDCVICSIRPSKNSMFFEVKSLIVLS